MGQIVGSKRSGSLGAQGIVRADRPATWDGWIGGHNWPQMFAILQTFDV